jgi:hypothetical protein
MAERTEEQKLFHDPIVVKLGGKEYKIKPLPIKQSREWRHKVWEIMVELPKVTGVKSDAGDKFEAALNRMLVSMPDEMVDLFFQYAKDLPRDEIESVATDSEMAVAWGQVTELAFPLLPGLVRTMGQMAPKTP